MVCVKFNEKWLPYVLGCLFQLSQQTTFLYANADEFQFQQENVAELIYIFSKSRLCEIDRRGEIQEEFMAIRTDCDCITTIDCPEGGAKTLATTDQLTPPSQPGEGSKQPSSGGGTAQYCQQLFANSKLLLPLIVSTGDVIDLISASGAGNDGTGLIWNCPNGDVFFAGFCQTSSSALVGTDPLPTAPHMSLIANVGGTYVALSSSPYTVPSGVSNATVTIQINDDDLTNNSGAYQICVNVTNNQLASWSVTLDFALSRHGFTETDFTPFPETTTTAYVPGKGFVGTGGGFGDYCVGAALMPLSGSGFIDQIIVTAYSEGLSGVNQLAQWAIGGTIVSPTTMYDSAIVASTNAPINHIITQSVALSTPQWLRFDLYESGSVVGDIVMSKAVISGRGHNPFV